MQLRIGQRWDWANGCVMECLENVYFDEMHHNQTVKLKFPKTGATIQDWKFGIDYNYNWKFLPGQEAPEEVN